jgi:excisionase family DNA binding protein
MTEHVLDPASAAEAEMAAIARACIVTALDHSNTEFVNVTISIDGQDPSSVPVLQIPPQALRFFADILRQMARREPMVLMPQKTELTTQEAATFLNVSRPFVIKEIEADRIKCRLVNRHRRIEFEELKRYQQGQKQRTEQALKSLHTVAAELGQEL